MSTCDNCPKPGACCTDFALNIGRVPAATWLEAAKKKIEGHNLPFYPSRPSKPGMEIAGEPLEVDGMIYVRFSCTRLTPEGRCGDYERRPMLCRVYQPKQDSLCVLHEPPATEQPIHFAKEIAS